MTSSLPIILLVITSHLAAVDRAATAAHHAELVHATYADSLAAARELAVAIDAFVPAPSGATLSAAKAAWLEAREPYGQSEAFRFYGGPIDGEDGPEGLLNAWPLDEAYIDYTVDGTAGGIIADAETHPEITAALLVELNERHGDANISTGYHAIEFLLWGQDLSRGGPGARPLGDYRDDPLAARRKAYLQAVTERLLADLEYLVAAWAPDADNYRAAFVADPETALGNIVVGMGSLSGGELAGERMAVALENKDQEDEHSCFSDNTHRDIITNQQGIANVWTGSYRRRDGSVLRGPGLRDLVQEADPELASEVEGAIAEATAAILAIPYPFDRAIVEDDQRPVVQDAIEALWRQTRLLPEVAEAIGVEAAIEGL